MSISTKNQGLTLSPLKEHDSPRNQQEKGFMSVTHLETNFEAWKSERCPEMKTSDAFEIYTIEQILKSKDPSFDDIQYGNVPRGMTQGVDGFYFYFDSSLIKEDVAFPNSAKTA